MQPQQAVARLATTRRFRANSVHLVCYTGPRAGRDDDGGLPDFFAALQGKVAQDFQTAPIYLQLGSFRFILDSASAAISLREIVEERLLGAVTFADLAAREKLGDSPRLMINSTLFNDGRRLLFTTLPPDTAHYDFCADLDRSLTSSGITST